MGKCLNGYVTPFFFYTVFFVLFAFYEENNGIGIYFERYKTETREEARVNNNNTN